MRKNFKKTIIEAVMRKEHRDPDYSDIIGKLVNCKMDRPLGSTHPRFPQMVYPVNYGYVEGIFARDGAEQDIYLLGINEPVEEYFGRVVAVYHRLNDNEDKWIVVPDGYEITEKEILDQISFQERFFEGELDM